MASQKVPKGYSNRQLLGWCKLSRHCDVPKYTSFHEIWAPCIGR